MKRPRRHLYSQSEIVRTAFMAGAGATAAEIADALGVRMSVRRVYDLVRRHGLRLVPRNGDQATFAPLTIARSAMAEFERVCEPLGADPHFVAARVLERAAGDSAKLREIAKEVTKP